jgi:hypothetical protein
MGPINAFDIETFINENGVYIPYCVCFNLNKKYFYHYFEKNANLIELAITNIFELITKETTLFIHNLDFDGLIIISYLSKTTKYNYKAFARELSFYKIEIFFGIKKIVFVCSYKIFPLSLKQIALNFTPLKKFPFPYGFSKEINLFYAGVVPASEYWNDEMEKTTYINNFGNFFNFKDYSVTYCLNDVKITHFFIEKILEIIKEFNINIKKIYSGPSLALKIFIKHFNKNKISFTESGFYDKLVRGAYYGGRCEVYGNALTNEYIYHYDFSGMYAQCMQEKFAFGNYNINTSNFNLNKPGFYWIEFESNMDRPVLPIHHNLTGKLIFPNGKHLSGCY